MSASDLSVSPNILRLSPYVPGKPLEELERELGIRDAVKLASNENPMGASPRALEAAAAALRGAHRYPDGHKLRAALSAHHGVRSEELVLGNGSNELIDLICRTFAGAVQHTVYPDPSFVCYRSCTVAANMPGTEVPPRGDVHYDIDALIAAVRPETGLLFLANPNNPTGAYVGRADLEKLLRAVPERTLVVLDEAYVEFADAPDFVSALELRDLHENLMVLRTFSKAYGLAALRVGYGIAPVRLVDYLDRVRAPFNVSSVGLAAAIAALEDQEHVRRYVELNRVERSRVSDALRARGLEVAPSQANFVLVNVQRPGRELYDLLLRRGVIVRPMGPPIANWLRITLGLPAENDRMLAALDELLRGGPMTRRSWMSALWALCFVLCWGCGHAAAPKVEPPPPPKPPTAPLAWMPPDSQLLAHVTLAPFRSTPVWDLWTNFQNGPNKIPVWVDESLIDEVTAGGKGSEELQPSFVAVIKGRFGQDYLQGLATRDQLAGEQLGLLRVYRRSDSAWAQLSPELVLACSLDELDWLVARAAQGDATPIKDTPLFQSLSPRLGFETSELAVLMDDPEGKGRARLEQDTSRFGVSIPDEVIRAGISVDMGPTVILAAMAEAATPEGAAQIRSTAEGLLDSLASNMFVGMFGLRPFVKALKAESEGSHVAVRGSITAQELDTLLGKLKSLIALANGQRAR